MTKELLQQALNEAKADAIEVFTYEDGIAQSARDAIEYMHSWLGVYFEKQALAQQAHFEEQPDGTVIPVDPSEMAQQEQTTQEPVVVQKRVRYESGDYSAWTEIPMSEADNQYRDCVEIRKLYTAPPTQPALSDGEIYGIVSNAADELWPGISRAVPWTSEDAEFYEAIVRKVEARCRGDV